MTLLFMSVLFLKAEEKHTPSGEATHQIEKKKFEPGSFMFDHIGDAYEWHIMTVGHKHISIPLPVILYSKTKGLSIFMSGRFHHGHNSYKGYKLEMSGENKGKITDEEGNLPLDLSITKNVASLLFSIGLILWIFLAMAKPYKRNALKPPRGIQSFLEPIVVFIRDEVAIPSIGKKKYEVFMPYLLTVFFFILFNNVLGLIPVPPGGANLTGNISVTFVLALFTFIITTIRGNRNYWKHIFNTPGVPVWLKIPVPLMPLVETIGIFTKPFVLMVRLFANITAGHIIALGFLSLIYIFAEMSTGLAYGVSIVSIVFLIFMTFLELLVAFIQAFVFTFLSALYFGMATEEHH
ncbi:MAG: F0F1 ATP synthase subunit A [Bacteroidales bacterium]|nr:F0F1 ATP synthase subunit A [Bacteroidales bacterium]MBN2764454.1 F0F1 ATP synthase subunit A [Bacteroidales bacterium]